MTSQNRALVKSLSSKAPSPRVGWFLPIININGILEVNLGWKSYDKTLSFYSTANRSSSVKPPWGPIVSVDFHQATNKRNEPGMYFKFVNKDGESRNFKADVFHVMVAGVNDFTQKCQELVVEKRSKLLTKYLSLLVKKKGFVYYRPDLYSEDGLPLDETEASAVKDDLQSHGGNVEDYIVFANAARDNAFLVVEDRNEILLTLQEGIASTPTATKQKR